MARTGNGQTAWPDVYRRLRADITSGQLSPGSDLPTLGALADEAGLTPHGARRVMDRLRADGLVQSWQGKGYRVMLPRVRLKITEKRPVFGERLRAMGFHSTSHLVSSQTSRVSHKIGSRMGRRAGTKILGTETLRKINGHAVAVSMDYFPRDRFQGLDDHLKKLGSVSKALAAHGVMSYRRDHTALEARLPTAHEALLLRIPRTQPVYQSLGANLDDQGTIVQVSMGVWRADCVVYEF